MAELEVKEKLEDLYEKINEEEKKGNNKEVSNLINNFIENLNKEKKKLKKISNNEVVEDVTESLKIIDDAYQKKLKNNYLNLLIYFCN